MASNKTKIEFEKVLVLGGAGFIGRSVADELADSGYLVTIYDLAEPGELKQNQRYIKGDILNVELLWLKFEQKILNLWLFIYL